MGKYTRTMSESLSMLSEVNNMELMRKAAGGAMQTLKMKDGKIQMDSFTASAIMKIYDKVNDKNKKTMENMLKDGKRADIMKLQKFAMSKINAEYVPEEKGPRQLTDPNKEVMVVKKNKVVVIDKKDKDKYMKKGWELAEEIEEGYKPVKDDHYDVKVTVSDREVDKVKSYIMNSPEYNNGEIEDVDSDQVDGGGQAFKGKGDIFIQGDGAGSLGVDLQKEFGRKIKVMGEGVELDEAKYDLYHKDFSSAMQHAYKMAEKLYGITVDPKEIDDKVATGPSKPGSGKTNSYRLKGDKGAIQVQVYNKGGSKPFELNMYKEEVELDEGTKQVLAHGGKGKYKVVSHGDGTVDVMFKGKSVGKGDFDRGADSFFMSIKGEKGQKSFDDAQAIADYFAKNKIKEEADLDEARIDPADIDMDATDDDIKSADKNIMMQMRKVQSLRGNYAVEFMDGKKVKVDPKVAMAVQSKYMKMRRPAEKEMFQAKISKSYKDMLSALKEGFASDAQRRAAFASGYKEKGKKKKESTLQRISQKIQERKNG